MDLEVNRCSGLAVELSRYDTITYFLYILSFNPLLHIHLITILPITLRLPLSLSWMAFWVSWDLSLSHFLFVLRCL